MNHWFFDVGRWTPVWAIMFLLGQTMYQSCTYSNINEERTELVAGTPKGASTEAKGEVYLLIVGISEYQAIDNLQYCDDDARLFHNLFNGSISPSNIVLLQNRKATKKNILSAMKKLFSRANENDKVIFYFSGHGANGVFCNYDIQPAMAKTHLTHQEIKEVFRACKASTKLLIADACRAGSLRSNTHSKTIDLGEAKDGYNNFEDQEHNVIVFASSRASEASEELPELQNGIFTYYLVKGLKGAADFDRNKYITIGEWFLYTKQKIVAINPNQHPVLFGKFSKNLSLVKLK